MYKLTPKIVAEIIGGTYIGSDDDLNTPITGAARDNRDVRPGNLFICIKGERTDGHLYVGDAFKAGAACCLTQREIPNAQGPYVITAATTESIKTLAAYHRSQFDIPVIGITGSVGKTTTKELVAAVLGAKYHVLKTEKNLNNELGVPLTLLSLTEKHEAAVIEMGISDFGEMSRLAAMVRPDIFIMTKIGYAHIKELGDLRGVLRAKTEAFAYMKPSGIAIMSGDDELLRTYKTGLKTITFGLEPNNDFRAENTLQQGVASVAFDIVCNTGELTPERFPVQIAAYGSHIAALAPAAAAAGSLLSLSVAEIEQGFRAYIPIEGRSNVSYSGDIILIDDCYNANPTSVKAALTSLSSLNCRRVAILGDMLNLSEDLKRSNDMHFEIGKFAAECGIDILLCHGDESRYICSGYKNAGGLDAEHFGEIEKLMSEIPKRIKKGDAVLVKASHGMHFERLLPVISAREQHKKTV